MTSNFHGKWLRFGSLLAPFRLPFRSISVPLAPFRLHFGTLFASGRPLAPLRSLSAPFWHPLAPIWLHIDTLWLQFGSLLACFSSLWRPLSPHVGCTYDFAHQNEAKTVAKMRPQRLVKSGLELSPRFLATSNDVQCFSMVFNMTTERSQHHYEMKSNGHEMNIIKKWNQSATLKNMIVKIE